MSEIGFRPFRPEDHESLAKHANNINIWNNTRDYLPYPYTERDAADFIAYATAKSPVTDYAVTVNGLVVGAIGIIPGMDVERISAEIGYWLGEEYWGRGIMTAIVIEFTKFIFSQTAISHLFAGIFEYNKASMRVLEKSGFTFVGVMHRAALKNKNVIDMYYYEKLKYNKYEP